MKLHSIYKIVTLCIILIYSLSVGQEFVEYPATLRAPGNAYNIVLISGDDEYRSEESLPMLGKILAGHHGFNVRVVFAVDPANDNIAPDYQKNIPGLEALDSADLMIMLLRFRNLPSKQMKPIVDFTNSGKPIIGLRTTTHAFKGTRGVYGKYNSTNSNGGYGKIVFGNKWEGHHGKHAIQSSRGVLVDSNFTHPVLRGVDDIWGPSDVYGVKTLPENTNVLVNGQVLSGMNPSDNAVEEKGLTPLIWERLYTGDSAKKSQVLFSTIGASQDFESEDLRRVIVNSTYWMLGLGALITDTLNVNYVDAPYEPSPFGFDAFIENSKPADYAMVEKFEPWPEKSVGVRPYDMDYKYLNTSRVSNFGTTDIKGRVLPIDSKYLKIIKGSLPE